MISYNTKKWTVLLNDFSFLSHKAYNKIAIYKAILFIAIYVTGITFLKLDLSYLPFNLSPIFFSMVGIILSMVLVFRLNTAYDKWWEGRKLWGALINDCRTLGANFAALIPKEYESDRRYVAAQIGNFAHALKNHLRDVPDYIDLDRIEDIDPDYYKTVTSAKHVPYKIAHLIFEKMEDLYKRGIITAEDKINLKTQIQHLIDILGACERIKNTPIPYSHSSFIKTFILLYVGTLPFGLISTFGYLTIPISVLISYILVGVEIISEEVENPFGLEDNDLPLNQLACIIHKNVYDLYEIENAVTIERGREQKLDVVM